MAAEDDGARWRRKMADKDGGARWQYKVGAQDGGVRASKLYYLIE